MPAFLFTDIEDSTRLWNRFPDAMARALAEHDRILRKTIEEHGGNVFKTAGDAFYAVFPDPLHALQAALQAQLVLHRTTWPPELGELRVRMALTYGTVREREGDFFGPPLNLCARLLDAAHGGQVLVDRRLHDAVQDRLLAPARLRDLGRYTFKGLEEPERVYQLLHPDLPHDFPPLRTLEAISHNLPRPTTPLVDREEEMRVLVEALQQSRCVVLSGPPGIGKTRLAVEVAQHMLTHFPDGVWWFEASRVEDPERLPLDMIRMLGMRGTPGKPPLDLLVERLYARQMLWVLDGLHRADGTTRDFLQSLLQRTRHLRILITATRSLHLEGSTQVRVGPLRTGDLPDPETNPAYALLLSRIRQHRPEYQPDTRDQEALLKICRRLDGLPLALELAAARCRLRTPRDVLERLDETLHLSDREGDAGDRRVQTLHQTLQWNISQLDEEERRFLWRFSLFPDGLTAQAMEVTVGYPPLDVARLDVLLSSLLDKSLIMPVDLQRPRYRIPETVRRWIHETPEARQEESETYRQYLAWILEQLERFAPELVTGESSRALSFFQQEKENLRVVLRWARSHTPEGAQALGARLWRFFYAAGEFEEGRIWLTPLSEASPPRLTEDLATVDMGLGVLALYRGQMEEARTYLMQARQRFHELQRPAREGEVLNILGLLYLNTGDLEQARNAFEQALQLRESAGDASGVATVLNNLGLLARETGDLREARRLFLLSFQKNQQLGRKVESARALANLAEVHQLLEEYSHAERRYEQALQIFLEAGDRLSAARVYQDLGVLAMDRGDWDTARERLERARLLFQELHHDAGVAGVSLNLATLAWKRGNTEQAGDFFLRALALFLSQHHARGIRTTLHHWLRFAAEQKDPRTFALLDVLWERLQERGMLPALPDSLWNLRQQIRQQVPERYHELEEEPLWGLWERLDPLLESMPDMLWLE